MGRKWRSWQLSLIQEPRWSGRGSENRISLQPSSLHTTPEREALPLLLHKKGDSQEEDVSTHLGQVLEMTEPRPTILECNHPASYPRDHSFLNVSLKWDSNMLCRLILWSVSPSRTPTPQGQTAQFYQWLFKPGGITGTLSVLYQICEMKRPSQSWLFSFQSSAANGLSDTVMRLKLRVENSSLNQSSPFKVPSHLLSPWDGEESEAWDGKETERKRAKGRRKRRTEKKNAQSKKCRYCSGFLVFSTDSNPYGRGIRLNNSQLVCVTTTGSGQCRCSINHIKEPINK